jgi:hypothetical protein
MFYSMPLVGVELIVTYICSIVSVVIMIWGLVILLKAIGEAQQFSAWKALLKRVFTVYRDFYRTQVAHLALYADDERGSLGGSCRNS